MSKEKVPPPPDSDNNKAPAYTHIPDIDEEFEAGATFDEIRDMALPANPPPRMAIEEFLDLSDQGDANRLAERHGEHLRYCPGVGWLVWNGRYWERGDELAPNLASESSHFYFEELDARYPEVWEAALERNAGSVQAAEKDPAVKSLRAAIVWATNGKNVKRIDACLRRAQGHSDLLRKADDFDTHKHLLTVENGTVNLKTGTRMAHNPAHYITRCAPVKFDRKAKCPVFDGHIQKFQPDVIVQGFLQRWFGYCATSETREQVMTFMLGNGANGKGTMVETIRNVLGEYAMNASAATIMGAYNNGNGGNAPSPAIARMVGRRLMTVSEVKEDEEMNEALVKSITGEDKLTACHKYKDPFEFTPTCKVLVSMNHKPKISGVDNGIWRRIVLVPFDFELPEADWDKKIRERLQDPKEMSGILNWIVEGAVWWYLNGLCVPDSMKSAKQNWRAEEDEVSRFVEECCTIQPLQSTLKTPAKTVCDAYNRWARDNGCHNITQKNFTKRIKMVSRNIISRESNGKTVYDNITMLDGEGGGWRHDVN